MKIAKILPMMGLLVLSGTAWGQSGICHSGSGPDQSLNTVDPNLVLIVGGNDPIYFCKKRGGNISETVPESRFNSSSGRTGSGTVSLGSAQGAGELNATSITLAKTSNYGTAAGSYSKTLGFNVGSSYPDSVYNFMAYYNRPNNQLGGYSGNTRDAKTRSFCLEKQQVVINYLKANPQIFLANGVASTSSDQAGNYVAKNVIEVNGATVTTYFQNTAVTAGNKYASNSESNDSNIHHYIYCLVSVVPQMTMDLNTLKRAGAHQITYSVQPQ